MSFNQHLILSVKNNRWLYLANEIIFDHVIFLHFKVTKIMLSCEIRAAHNFQSITS